MQFIIKLSSLSSYSLVDVGVVFNVLTVPWENSSRDEINVSIEVFFQIFALNQDSVKKSSLETSGESKLVVQVLLASTVTTNSD